MVENAKLRRALAASAFAAVGAVCAGGAAMAASDGNLGNSSQGSLSIDATIPQLVRITNLDDIGLGQWNGTDPMTGSDDVCVFSTTRSYTVSAAGDGTGGAFTLADGSGNTLPYSVNWTDGTTSQALSTGVASATMSAPNNSVNCNNGVNATVSVQVDSADAGSVPAGTYSGTLTLTVSPQ